MSINLLAIVGQTAGGKSELAVRVARLMPAEIIAADSRTIYKSLDIGTAKPSAADQAEVPHHLLDVVEPDQAFTVADFQARTQTAIADILAREKMPILVGGSGLYIDSILCNYDFSGSQPANYELRQSLSQLSTQALQQRIIRNKLTMPENDKNRRYLIRTLERGTQVRRGGWRKNAMVIGLEREREALRSRIEGRLERMLDAGLIDEVASVLAQYSWECEALKSNIYQSLKPYFLQQSSLEEALADFVRRDLSLAKKQLTWFKRHPRIQWFKSIDDAYEFIKSKQHSMKPDIPSE